MTHTKAVPIKCPNPSKVFVNEMNKYAVQLKLLSTNFMNPHGLSDKKNYSTAADIGKLGCIVM